MSWDDISLVAKSQPYVSVLLNYAKVFGESNFTFTFLSIEWLFINTLCPYLRHFVLGQCSQGSSAVECIPGDQEAVGLNPAGCCFFKPLWHQPNIVRKK